MKITAIKKLVEIHTLEELVQAEEALLDEKETAMPVEGEDEGEKLTHIFAAIWVLNKMKDENLEFKVALREYTKKVRESIN